VVGKSKVLEVVSYLIENGASKTCEAFNLTEETLNRYKREARKQFGEGLEAVVKLSEKLSIAEMNQLSSGSLHVPTGGKKHVIDFSGEEVTFGVMSDTHVGSIWTEPDHILKAFEEMKKQGCTMLFHAADLCVKPGSLVTTRAGLVPIEQVKVGDVVLTHRNRWHKVLQCFEREVSEPLDMYSLDSSHVPDLSITKNHPVFVTQNESNGAVGGKTLFLESSKVIPLKNHVMNIVEDNMFKPMDTPYKISCKSLHDKVSLHVNEGALQVDEDLFSVIGIFLGDGTCKLNSSRGTVSFSLNTKGRKQTLNKTILQRFADVNGFNLMTYTHENQNCESLYINSKPLAEFFNQFYDSEGNKHLPLQWVNLPSSQFLQIIYGLILADGTLLKRRGVRLNSTSASLLKTLKLRLEMSGIYCSMNLSRPNKISWVLRKLSPTKAYYELGFYNATCNVVTNMFGSTISSEKAERRYNRFDYCIKSIYEKTEGSYTGKVYNIEVEEDNSYIANGVVVHNCEGMMGRPGDIYELSHVGYKAQRDEAVRIFSQWKLPLYIPSGNHDGSFNTKLGAGMDIVEDVCSRLEGANYLGINDGDLILNGVTIKLWHGGDGSSYSLGYRDQKLIESFTGGEKPNILITGHIHKAYYFFYRNIHTIGAGSMQKQSGWMRAKKLQAHTGFWVVKACLAKGEVKWISPRWYPYYT
jgi:predicted phosphodiesterase